MLKGKVVDNLESPLPGATITIEGSTRGVTTDIDGSFSIEVTPTDKIIVQFLGMESQTITVGNQNDITIKLKEKADLLDRGHRSRLCRTEKRKCNRLCFHDKAIRPESTFQQPDHFLCRTYCWFDFLSTHR